MSTMSRIQYVSFIYYPDYKSLMRKLYLHSVVYITCVDVSGAQMAVDLCAGGVVTVGTDYSQ